jgi:hypothetical protein
MQIVLQHVKSGLYLKSPGVWTKEVGEALDFSSSQRAIRFIRQHQLEGVQVLVAFIEPAYVETVALQMPQAAPGSVLRSAAWSAA